MSTMMDSFYKYGTAAGVWGVAVPMIHGSKGTKVQTPAGEMPLWAVGAGIGVGASVGADIISTYVVPHLVEEDRLKKMDGALTHLGANAGGGVLAAKIVHEELNADLGGYGSFAAQAAVLGLISEKLYTDFVKPMVGSEKN